MSGLIDTTEMYLRTILELEEEGVVPMRARIAERLDQSGPTVSQTVARMERDGLVAVASDRHLELTDEGRRLGRVPHADHGRRRPRADDDPAGCRVPRSARDGGAHGDGRGPAGKAKPTTR